METNCIAKYRPCITGENVQIQVKIFGYCEKYYPLSNLRTVKNIISELRRNIFDSDINYNIISHSNEVCNYTHPVESWMGCNFESDFTNHCLSVCMSSCNYLEKIIQLDFEFNTIFIGKEFINPMNKINYVFMSIKSDSYLKYGGIMYHISELNSPELDILYFQMSNHYGNYITLAENFKGIHTTPQSKIFLIPSILHVENSKTIYSPEERFKQTLNQVKSIKERVVDSIIIILELSWMNLKQIYKISKYSSALIFFTKDQKALSYAHDKNKNKAEIYLQSFILSKIETPFSHFCKFGGRYSLTNIFDEKVFFSEELSFRIIPKAYDGVPIVESILYSVPYVYKKIFIEILVSMQLELERFFGDVEHLLYNYCVVKFKLPINKLYNLGIKGHFAVDGAYNPS
jgi:hypothetical protein